MQTQFLLGIPLMNVPGAAQAKTRHYGAGIYGTTIENTTKNNYDEYLKLLEEYSFVKYTDNGEGLGETVFSATYVRDNLVLGITYFALQNRTYISVCPELRLSEHLTYKESYVKGVPEDAKTTLHFMELWCFGNGFVFQLKNGHFIISDGGTAEDLPYLLDYLESLVLDGEKPIIEAWVISHSHGDHHGALRALNEHPEWRERILLDGIYFNEPEERISDPEISTKVEMAETRAVARRMRAADGSVTGFYRPQTGQRYYFCDITMDILACQEQFPEETYCGWINDSSTIYLFTIEGQKCFFSGDAENGGLGFVMENYTSDFLELDVFTLNHHGFNTLNTFTDYTTIQTVFMTTQNQLPVRCVRENNYLKSKVKEWFVFGDGTKVMEFPYQVGNMKCLEPKKWIYNDENEKRPIQPNVFTFGRRKVLSLILKYDVIYDENGPKSGVVDLLQHMREHGVSLSVVSNKSREQVVAALKKADIEEYFQLIFGLETINGYVQVTKEIVLEDYHKHLIIGGNMGDVYEANEFGMRIIVIPEAGVKADEEMEERSWKILEKIEDIVPFFEYRGVRYE